MRTDTAANICAVHVHAVPWRETYDRLQAGVLLSPDRIDALAVRLLSTFALRDEVRSA